MKKLNAELIQIRDNLQCRHCNAIFKGSNSQAYHFKYSNRITYCSPACRLAGVREKLCTPIPERGPCKTCGNLFHSRTAKIYCSMVCYSSSEQFKKMIRDNLKKASRPVSVKKRALAIMNGTYAPCLECGEPVYSKPSRSKKYCSKICYRSYMAKRFDRWIANPESMALPQCYDEFLDRDVLTCVVDGCDWEGIHLTTHMNQCHGIRADDFKRAVGFNLSTGVISKPLAEVFRERSLQGVAMFPFNGALDLAHEAQLDNPIQYKSLEAKEHAIKSRLLCGPGPLRVCHGCGEHFQQTTVFGYTKYHSIECRTKHYAENRDINAYRNR